MARRLRLRLRLGRGRGRGREGVEGGIRESDN